jgi:two-component system chemotaxis response regulator CheY
MTQSAPQQILLVEDDTDIQEAMSEILTEEGFLVTTANHGAEGLAALAKPGYVPDLILLDLMMPVMDGHTFRRAQQDHPAYSTIPVVVISADRNAREKSETMQAAAFLPKPIDLDALLTTLASLLAAK